MHVKRMKEILEECDDYDILIIGDWDDGWCNVDDIVIKEGIIEIKREESPVFDN